MALCHAGKGITNHRHTGMVILVGEIGENEGVKLLSGKVH